MRYAVIGWPLGHTVSPALHQAAFDALGLEAAYLAAPTPPEQLAQRLRELREGQWRGLNVTIPHKVVVAGLLDVRTQTAERLGAVNTISAAGARLTGDNTDAEGFLRALNEHGGFDPRGQRAVALGAGGAGRAVAWALAEAGVAHLTIANRSATRAVELARALTLARGAPVEPRALDDPALRRDLAEAHLLVNATSAGMAGGPAPDAVPVPPGWLHAGLLVYDLVYRPARTPLLAAAAQAGCRTLGGVEMLVYQGAASFARWTGRVAPVAVMMQAARQALAQAASPPKEP
ncbi:MAG: shikimate dehydrogenase [Actinobacteria bacterium]|nr:shikimate dehydrogenase [Actinomycetota bacterium]